MNQEALITRLEEANALLRDENSTLRKAQAQRKAPVKLRGTLDKKSKQHSANVGIGCGFAGAWSDDIMNHVELAAQHAGGWVKFFYSVTMVSDITGWLLGFIVGYIAMAFYKVTQHYE